MPYDCNFLTVSDGEHLAVHQWIPENGIQKIIVLSHGMMEFAARYERFALKANEQGIAVYAPDHRGHGRTAGSLSRLGIVAAPRPFDRMSADLRETVDHASLRHPGLPVILMGHSFGSFLALHCIEIQGTRFSGCILSGSRGPDPIMDKALRILSFKMSVLTGRDKPSPFLNTLAFGSCNKRIPHPATSNDWLSRDEAEVAAYNASPWCGFACSPGFYGALGTGFATIYRKKLLQAIPEMLPILLISGTDDPIGGYGVLSRKLCVRLQNAGIRNVSLSLYQDGRHELLNDLDRDQVTQDLMSWINALPLTQKSNL